MLHDFAQHVAINFHDHLAIDIGLSLDEGLADVFAQVDKRSFLLNISGYRCRLIDIGHRLSPSSKWQQPFQIQKLFG